MFDSAENPPLPEVTALSADLSKALAGIPKRPELVIATGQHGKSEPLAAYVGKRIAQSYSAEYKPTSQISFPEGLDHMDAPSPELYKQTVEPKGAQQMANLANKAEGQVVFNFHEKHDVWTRKPGDSYVVDFIFPPQLSVPAQDSLSRRILTLNDSFSEAGIPLLLTTGSMSSLGSLREKRTGFNPVPANMVVVEIHTPVDTYQSPQGSKSDTLRVREDPAVVGQTGLLADIYSEALKQLLPVVSHSVYETIRDPRNIYQVS